jgi:hypothetical protein
LTGFLLLFFQNIFIFSENVQILKLFRFKICFNFENCSDSKIIQISKKN